MTLTRTWPEGLIQDVEAEQRFEQAVGERIDRLNVDATARERIAAAQAAVEGRPTATPLVEFLSQHDPDPTWSINGLLATGANAMIVAQYKAGKSTLIGNLIRALADGTPFLGDHATLPGTVTLIDNELDERTLRRWLRDQQIQNAHMVRVIPLRGRVSSFNILEPFVRAKWADAIRGSRTLLFDCLRPALDGLGLSEDKDAGRFLTAFDALKYEAGVQEAAVVHHMGHNGERSRGDSRILDWPDVTWKITREDKDNPASRRYFSAFGRDVDLNESQLEYEPATRHLSLGGLTRIEARVQDHVPQVLAVLSAAEGRSQNWIEQELKGSGIGTTAIRSALEAAYRQGHTIKVSGARGAILHSLRPTSPDLEATSPNDLETTSPTRPLGGEARSRSEPDEDQPPRRGEVSR